MWPFSNIFTLSSLAFHLFDPFHETDRPHERATLSEAHIHLTPTFHNEHGAATGINISMILRDPKAHSGLALLTLPLEVGPTPSARYDGNAIIATDNLGLLELRIQDGQGLDPWRKWIPSRDPDGDVVFTFFAPPRQVNKSTPAGPRIDLQATQGGLFGKGLGFLPYPLAEEDWSITLEWHLQHAPEGTRAAWSIGDELVQTIIGHPKNMIGDTFYAVGPLSRWPDWNSGETARCKTYWIGKSPWDMQTVAAQSSSIFETISRFFTDTDQDQYAVFFRQVPNSFGGTGGHLSFLIEYIPDDESGYADISISQILAHEILHSYPMMPIEDSADNGWYVEGVAEYYSVIFLYRDGIMSKKEFVDTSNKMMQGYYTNPVVNRDMTSILDHYWESIFNMRVPYGRGWIYLLQANGLVVEATGGRKSVDDLVLELYRRQMRRDPHDSDVFVNLLGDLIGREKAKKSFEGMWRGDLIVPSSAALAADGLRVRREDCFPFELGFEYRSGYVRELVEGSRAEKAGVQEDDEILGLLSVWSAADTYLFEMEASLKRNATVEKIRWWPRGHGKTECWWWEEDETSGLGEL